MALYVLVDADGIAKEIKFGPVELDDPSTYVVPEGSMIMLESEALAQGYHFSAGGAAIAPGEPTGDGKSHGHEHEHGHHGGHGHEEGHKH
ncbi:hypothetical protein [Streptomyces sp. NPDC001089]